jgi:hypothetical protein
VALRPAPALLLLGRDGYRESVLFADGRRKEGSCSPQALAACLNAGDRTSAGLLRDEYSPGLGFRLTTSDPVGSGSGNCENPCARVHRVNASAARNSAADGAAGPCLPGGTEP